MSKRDTVKQISDYLDGKLTSAEQVAFEKRLDSDDDLREQLAFEQLIRTGIEYSSLKSAKKELDELENSKATRRQQGKYIFNYSFKRSFGIAATILLVAIAGWLIISILNKPGTDELFAAYFEPYPNLFYQEQRAEEGTDEKILAFQLYEDRDYGQAIEAFSQLLKKGYDPGIEFYLGIAYLGNDQPVQSIETFEQFLKRNNDMRADAQWYLALAFVKNGEREKAKHVLSQLSNGNEGEQKVRKLLKQLE